MKNKKAFDCVEMKNKLQEAMLREYAGLNDAQRRKKMQNWLETSDDLIALKWRKLMAKQNQPAGMRPL